MRIVRALWGSSHPGPTLVVTALSACLGLAAGLDPWRIALLAAAVFFGQLSIGISNDAIDAARDRAVGRTDKPLARGEISVRTAWIGAVASIVVALGLSAPLGWGVVAGNAVIILSGWIYNRPLKSTPFSIVRPSGYSFAHVHASRAHVVSTSTDQPSSAAKRSASSRAAISAPPITSTPYRGVTNASFTTAPARSLRGSGRGCARA